MPKFQLQKKHFLYLGLVCLAIICGQILRQVYFKPPVTKEIPLVRIQTIQATNLHNTSEYPGEVRGNQESTLAFQVPGKIITRRVNLGDTVTAGQVLMQIDPKDIAQTVSANSAAVNAARSQYQLARDNAARYEKLYASGAVSQATMEQYQNQATAAGAVVQQTTAQLTGSEHQLEYTQLVADQDGVIAAVNGEVGQVVGAGMPMVTLVQNGQREVQFFIPENRLPQLQPGQTAQVSFWALANVTIPGHITEIAPMADAITRTYKVRVQLDEELPQIKLGMTAKVRVSTALTQGLTLASTAVYQTGDEPHVWLVVDKKVQLVPIKIAGYEGSNVLVTSGLNPGDKVVIAGINKLSANQQVRLEDGEPQ
ncbi:MAG: efflux RND transporter periplasmic adaptor subunit [Acidaminococcaceae bacterium]